MREQARAGAPARPFRSRLLGFRLIAAALLPAALCFAQTSPTLGFAVIGDAGTGKKGQWAVARAMEESQGRHGWRFVIALGDNIYENGEPKHFGRKFKQPYKNLFAAGVRFHSALGNHDRRTRGKGMEQVRDPAFGYVGAKDEYVFEEGPMAGGRRLVRFLCLNSSAWINSLEGKREAEPIETRKRRLEKWLTASGDYVWNILFMHHPLYSYTRKRKFFVSGGHGPEVKLRGVLEPMIDGRVDVVFSGHEHFYQKIRPRNGIDYFISGSAGKTRSGAKTDHPQVEFAAKKLHFMRVELSVEELRYEAVGTDGEAFHSGVIRRSAGDR